MSHQALNAWMVWRLGLAQLVGWGVTFYLPGAFAQAIASDLGWSRALVFSGLSLAMLVMGLVSPLAGLAINRYGGRQVMLLGALLNALGCLLLALCQGPPGYFVAWIVLGMGMRLSLYDAAFATLVALAGTAAGPAMQRITLLGGLASAVFWPLGELLLDVQGWRFGIGVYAGLALCGGALLWGLPQGKDRLPRVLAGGAAAAVQKRSRSAELLLAVSVMLTAFLAAGLSAHLPALLSGFGVSATLAALWGVGQVCARLADMQFGQGIDALRLNLWIGLGLALCFVLGACAGQVGWMVALFVFSYGACNGLATRVRAGLPLLLFAPAEYARKTATLLVPSFLLAALAPWCYAVLRQSYGDRAALLVSLVIALILLLVALVLWAQLRPRQG